MAEGTYEYECMRAELLGVEKPDYDQWVLKKKEEDARKVEQEAAETENLKSLEEQAEDLKTTGGKLDELNNILAATQKKIDRFKFRCGSVTEVIRAKIGSISGPSGDPSTQETEAAPQQTEDASPPAQEAPSEASAEDKQRKSDLTRALDNHVDNLDSLIEKAESAQFSMNQQNKQMRKFLK